jgi:hypothetical protein
VRRGQRCFAGLCALVPSLVAASLHAQSLTQNKAMAEVLFREATELAAKGQHVQACERFEGSQRYDAALGTILHLADCYDRVGRTASAWVWFVEARDQARASNQNEREQIASRRVADLERRLSTIRIDVGPEARLPGLTVEMNGAAVPATSFGVPIPVDPGRSYVLARAPGHATWTRVLYLEPGPDRRIVDLPPLSRPAPTQKSSDETARARSGPPRWVGFALGGGGLLGLGAATVFGIRAHDLDRQSRDECRSSDGNACNAQGKSLRDRAFGAANAATVAAVAGGALLAAGVTWVVLVPGPSSERPRSIELGARVTEGGASLEIGAAL